MASGSASVAGEAATHRLTDGTVGYELSSRTRHQRKISWRRALSRGRRGGRRSLQCLRCGRLGCRWRWQVRRRSRGSIGRRRGDLSGKLQTLRRIWEVPRARDHSSGHDPVDAREGYSRQCVEKRSCNLPGGGAYDTLAMVLSFDRFKLEVDVLREIPHEGENFTHTLVHDAQCGENVHDGARDGLRTLLPLE